MLNKSLRAIFILIVLSSLYFFLRELALNINGVEDFRFKLNYFDLILAVILQVVSYIFSTVAYIQLINCCSEVKKIGYCHGLSILSLSSFTKYLPGKVWTALLQMHFFSSLNISKAVLFYVMILYTFIAVIIYFIVGLALLFFSNLNSYQTYIILILVFLIVFDILFIKFNSNLFKSLRMITNKALNRDFICITITKKSYLKLHILHLISSLCYGFSAYFLVEGVGINAPDPTLLVASVIVSENIGLLAFIAPAGIGIRESVMLIILKNSFSIDTALVIVIITRLFGMLLDLTLAFLGYLFLLCKKLRLTTAHSSSKSS